MGPVCQWHTLRTGRRPRQPHPGHPSTETFFYNLGGMAEWLKAPVLKTGVGASSPGVRIPLPPPLQKPPTGVKRLNGLRSLGLSLSRLKASVPIRDVVLLRHPTPEPVEFPPSAARSAAVEEFHSIWLFPSRARAESPSRPSVRPPSLSDSGVSKTKSTRILFFE